MSFYDIYLKYHTFDFDSYFEQVTENDILYSINNDCLNEDDLLVLLSPKCEEYLENMAQRSQQLTHQHFGKTIRLFTPLYLSNYCESQCVYCGFNRKNAVKRQMLTLDEVEAEGKAIAQMGFGHIIILTGESPSKTPISYIADCVKRLKPYMASIAIEIYSAEIEDYQLLIKSGVDSFTMFQETYDPELYKKLHLAGLKKDYRYRLDTPERAAKAGMQTVNIGALLGLSDWRKEAFFTLLHAKYIQDNYPQTEVAISLPRIRPHVGEDFMDISDVSNTNFVQIMTASRIFLPRLGITLSTREDSAFRNNVIGLGVTKLSASAKTTVGGHADNGKTQAQFEVSDERSIDEVAEAIKEKGYQPVYKDWF